MSGSLTDIERMTIYRLPFYERSLISMRNQSALTDEDRWAICRAAIARAPSQADATTKHG